MKAGRQIRAKRTQEGIALLISIFILLLISVVAIALIVASGTESALAGNYRSSTGVYYAALAGLEEARSRLRPHNPSYFGNTSPGFLPTPPTPLAVGFPVYMINPLSSETVTPWDSSSTYADKQYNQEFASSGFTLPSSPPWTYSVWNTAPLNSLPFPGPLYKWVRINAVSEKSLNVPVAPSFSTPYDSTTPVYYDGSQLNIIGNGAQVLELTALAVLANGSQKLVQYLVAPIPVNLPPLPAALTLAGKITGGSSTVSYSSPSSNTQFKVLGTNYDCNGNPTGTGDVPAIGVFNGAETSTVINGGNGGTGIKPVAVANSPINGYQGRLSSPDVETVSASFSPAIQTPAGLDASLQPIIQNADVVITPTPSGSPPYLGTATGSNLTPLGMSTTNLLTIVVNGNLDISNWSNDGYGLLLVTGTFTYDPDTTWDGIILVIGQGIVNGSHAQYKQINGAMLVAKTRDGNNNLLTGPDLATPAGVGASVMFSPSMQGYGIRYSSCWIQKAQPTTGSKILSFHEISQ
jgi:hypothetical protein